MLALSRAEGQSIIIDGTIEVKVVKWSRSSVRLAIQAPREVSIDRDEIWRKIHPGEKTPLETADLQRSGGLLGPNGAAAHGSASAPASRLSSLGVSPADGTPAGSMINGHGHHNGHNGQNGQNGTGLGSAHV